MREKKKEAHSSIFGNYSTIHGPKTPCYALKFASFSSSKQVLLRTHLSFPSNITIMEKRLRIRGSVEEVHSEIVGSNVLEDSVRAKVRRKNLAVFVSGGGSNYKSLHEATVNGFIHGDISVLVTNKPGIESLVFHFFASPLQFLHVMVLWYSMLHCMKF